MRLSIITRMKREFADRNGNLTKRLRMRSDEN